MVDESCEKCGVVSSSPVYMVLAVLSMIIGAGLAYYVCCVCSPVNNDSTSALQIQLTDNPLQPNSVPQEGRISRSGVTMQRSEDAVMLARVMYQPARILVGYMQVITQIGKVLNIELPPMIGQIIETFKLLAMSVKSVLQLDWCAH